MKLLQPVKMEQAYIKAGFFGFQGSGKTTTAHHFAIGAIKHLGLKKPLAVVETEDGSDFLVKVLETEKIPYVRVKTRAFSTLMEAAKEAEKECSFLHVDSITHFWSGILTAKLEAVNAARAKKNKYPLTRLPMPAIGECKTIWNQWADFYRASNLHVSVAGRAGFEWDEEEDEQGNDKLVKIGTKMKAEGEFGYEPAFLVEMVRFREDDSPGAGWSHRAVVLKDKSDTINGKEFIFSKKKGQSGYKAGDFQAVWNAFKPYVLSLAIGKEHRCGGDKQDPSQIFVGEEGEAEMTEFMRKRKIALEELEASFVKMWPGQGAKEKACKVAVVEALFGVRSWTAVEAQKLTVLQEALKVARLLEECVKKDAILDGELIAPIVLEIREGLAAEAGIAKQDQSKKEGE